MNRLAISTATALLSMVCLPSAIASETKASKVHISVLGLSFGESPARVKEKLAPRFVHDPSWPNFKLFKGHIQESAAKVWTTFTPKSKRLARILIQLEPSNTDFDLVVMSLESWSQRLTNKYGAPTQSTRTASNADDIEAFRGEYKNLWRLADGTISCSIFNGASFAPKDLWVTIEYEQDAMAALEKAEWKSLSQQDL